MMSALAFTALLLSAASCYAIGYAIVAPRDAFLRTKLGITGLVIAALSFVPLPPQLLGMESASAGMGALPGNIGAALAWPAALPKGLYTGLWIVTSIAGLLVGLRIWNAGKPGWRASAATTAYDTSAAGRMRALIVMANSLPEVLDIMARMGADAKSTQAIAEELRGAGRRFSTEVPTSSADAYRMVSAKVGPAAASVATGLLLEGAGRTGAGQAAQ